MANDTDDDVIVCALLGIYRSEDAYYHDTGPRLVQTTWCGRENIREYAFQDAGHAALNGRGEGRLILCRKCRDAIVKALDHGFEGE